MSRRLRYQVAVSLDGFIAGPGGEYDWIVMDPSIDFAALFKEFDTAVMGRKTYEVLTAQGGHGAMPGLDVVVFSRTLPAAAHKGVRIFNDDPRDVVAALKAKPGRDIWLYGGGILFRSLLDAGLVDSVEVAVVPVLLGSGVPLLPPGTAVKLVLADQKILPASGIVTLSVLGAWRCWPRSSYPIHQAAETSGEEACPGQDGQSNLDREASDAEPTALSSVDGGRRAKMPRLSIIEFRTRALKPAAGARMKPMIRSLVSSVACLGVFSILVATAFAQADPGLGVWKLNVAKSTYSPGPAPKSATTTITAAGAGVKVVVDQVFADGPRHWEYTANNDGKDVAVNGNNPDADMVARTRVNATTVQTVLKKAGKATVTQTSVVSSDGKTRTVTIKGVNAKGQTVNNVAVYEKQ